VSDQGEVKYINRILEEMWRELIEQERTIYSAKVIEHAHNPRNRGRIDRPDAYKILHGPCGDTMEIYLRLDQEGIRDVTFMTDGCSPSTACGSMLTTMVQGISLEEASTIEPEDLLVALDGLPEGSAHCAKLAVNTLREAIANGYRRARAPSEESDDG
jgi:nitrogen fixation NifU-like protein